MNSQKFVAYYRVSTQKQGQSGLGLEAQKNIVLQFLNGGSWEVLKEFVEIETGKGANALSKRPVLKEALDYCQKNKAKLVIAKLDRLARNVHFISGLMESKVPFVACDLPEASELTLHMMAAFAQHEAQMISERTKAALAAAKERGVKLGNPQNFNILNEGRKKNAQEFANNLQTVLTAFIEKGMTYRKMVDELNNLNITTTRGKKWSLMQLQRTMKRLNLKTKKAN